MSDTDLILAALDSAHSPDNPDNRTNPDAGSDHAHSGAQSADRMITGQPPALALVPDILGRVCSDSRRLGVVGEERLVQLVYLSLTSRLLDWGRPGERPVSVCVKGTSSSGKSYATSTALKFFPDDAWIEHMSASPRYLFYADDDFSHRVLVVPEWDSVKDNPEQVALLRVLLSEGRIVHGTVEGEGKREARRIVKEGPTGLLLTTTATSVDGELETRLLSVTTDDTPEQTRRVFSALAGLENGAGFLDLLPWHELQAWLAEHGANRVLLPFLDALAALMPDGAPRLRRDFVSLLSLIRSHALLYQAQRERDSLGRIVATLDDYEAVRALVGDLIAEGVEASVTDAMCETVEAVQATIDAGKTHAGAKDLIDRLGIGRSATYDRIHRALRAGYIVNEAARNERGMRLVVGAPLPGSANFLPTADALVRHSSSSPPGQEEPHEETESEGLSGSPACPGDPLDAEPEPNGDGRRLTEQERQVLSDRVARARVEKENAERELELERIRAMGDDA